MLFVFYLNFLLSIPSAEVILHSFIAMACTILIEDLPPLGMFVSILEYSRNKNICACNISTCLQAEILALCLFKHGMHRFCSYAMYNNCTYNVFSPLLRKFQFTLTFSVPCISILLQSIPKYSKIFHNI